MAPSRCEDEAAIVRLIEAETAAWLDGDIERWSDCWVQADYVRRLSGRIDSGASVIAGFDVHRENVTRFMAWARDNGLQAPDVQRRNWNIRVGRDLAWVSFDQLTTMTSEPKSAPRLHYQIRVLERQGGSWKIAALSEVQTRLGHYTCPWVRVDTAGHVVELGPLARPYLREHRVLQIVGGRLCGRRRADTRRLRDALAKAADIDSILRRCSYTPVLFDTGEGGAPYHCWVANFDAMLVVLFDDEALLNDTLARASVMFGLSPGQMRVAAQIARGHDLGRAAERLGLRRSTVSTHVARMYQKLGVSTQAALIRELLNVDPPRHEP